MTLNELVDHLKTGLSETMEDVRSFSEDPDTAVRPEYLKTMAIARVLKAAVLERAVVRLEQDARTTLGGSVLPGSRRSGFGALVSRPGEVDIVVSVEENGWKHPVVLVENKRYAAGYSTIEKDAIRCAEFIAAQGNEGSIEVGVVTYLRRETNGLTPDHLDKAGTRALDRIEKKAATLASTLRVNHQHARIDLDTRAFATEADALAQDPEGMPAYLCRPPFKVWGAMEIFWRQPSRARLAKL